MKPPAIICDIDGTIADLNGRDPNDLEHVKEDKLKKDVYTLLGLYYTHFNNPQLQIIFVTGREEIAKEDTEWWLLSNGLSVRHLLMRPNDNQMANKDLKELFLNNYILPDFTPILALDDDYRVARMYLDNGITCFQVAELDFSLKKAN